VRAEAALNAWFSGLEANDAAAAAAAAAAPVVEAAPAVVEAAPEVEDPIAALVAGWLADVAAFRAEKAAEQLRLDYRVAGCTAACVSHRILDGMTVRQAVRRYELDRIPDAAPGLAGLMDPYADL